MCLRINTRIHPEKYVKPIVLTGPMRVYKVVSIIEGETSTRVRSPIVPKSYWVVGNSFDGGIPGFIEDALNACNEAVKANGTLLLRAELVSACDDISRVNGEIEELKRERDDLLRQVADLHDELDCAGVQR